MSKYDKWYIIRKPLCSTFRICKKIGKFAKIKFFIAKSSYIVKMFAKKICPKNKKLSIFEKPLTMSFQICKNLCKILNNLILIKKKCAHLTGCLQKIAIFFRKTCAIRFLMLKAFQKAKFYQNLTSGSGSKQRFSLLQEKQSFRQCAWGHRQLILKPGFRPKGEGFGYVGKVSKFQQPKTNTFWAM